MTAAEKIDLFREHKGEYVAAASPVLIDVPPARYLSIAGRGRPAGPDFLGAVEALYSMAYTTKMMSKARGCDYVVCKLEGLWHIDGDEPFATARPQDITYTLLIRTPDLIDDAALSRSRQALAPRQADPRILDAVSLQELREGRCVQMLHVGPFEREAETRREMERFAAGQGLTFTGTHHEIYLSDWRRVAPERLRTLLRYPVGWRA